MKSGEEFTRFISRFIFF